MWLIVRETVAVETLARLAISLISMRFRPHAPLQRAETGVLAAAISFAVGLARVGWGASVHDC
jgi:hypothetical protein